MKTIFVFTFLQVLALVSFAEANTVDEKSPFKFSKPISVPTTFSISNDVGEIHIYESSSDNLEIKATYAGEANAEIKIDEPSPGKIKIAAVYPQNETVTTRNSSRATHVININGAVIIDGQLMKPTANGVVFVGSSGQVALHVGIPSEYLEHLKVDSISADIDVLGRFLNSNVADRQVQLKSLSGHISCGGLCAKKSIIMESQSGEVIVEGLRGNIFLKSTSGEVSVLGSDGNVKAESISGDVRISDHRSGQLIAKSISGDVNFSNPSAAVQEQGSTVSGRVRGMREPESVVVKTCSQLFAPKAPFDF